MIPFWLKFISTLALIGAGLLSPVLDAEDRKSREECIDYRINGETGEKIDLLLVGRGYSDTGEMVEDFRYYVNWDDDMDRGLFDVYPFNLSENKQKFNVRFYNARNISSYGNGLVNDSREAFTRCKSDYSAVLSKKSLGRSGFSIGSSMWVSDVSEKVERGNGAVGLIHEWGHAFGGLKDEYHRVNGSDRSGKPNCAPTRQKAEKWWGNMTNVSGVGFVRGCAYQKDNWEPHPGGTIMGDGGLWHYGPVNDRVLIEKLDDYS